MADVAEGIFSLMDDHAGLNTLVDDRIYPNVARQEAIVPYVVYRKVSNPGIHAMGSDPSISSPRMQVSSIDRTYAGAKAVAAQVALALPRGSTTAGGLTIQDILLDNDFDLHNPDVVVTNAAGDEVTGAHEVIQDFIVWHE